MGLLGRRESAATDVELLSEVRPLAPDGAPLLLSVKEAAEHLGISRGMLYELPNGEEIESLRIGKRRLISRDPLKSFVEANSHTRRRATEGGP